MSKYQKKTDNPKMGRPKMDIDPEQFEKLCAIQCTKEEIAAWFKCSPDTIENFCHDEYDSTFSAIYENKSAWGKVSLRRTQFKMADKSAAMAIWLGKQYLGQRDQIDTNVTGNGMLGDILGYMKQRREEMAEHTEEEDESQTKEEE